MVIVQHLIIRLRRPQPYSEIMHWSLQQERTTEQKAWELSKDFHKTLTHSFFILSIDSCMAFFLLCACMTYGENEYGALKETTLSFLFHTSAIKLIIQDR